MKKIIAALTMILALACTKTYAQDYKLAAGARIGVNITGITVKYNFNSTSTLEGIAEFANGFNVVGLYELNTKLGRNFNFYYGLGANVGAWKHSGLTLGVNAITGVEYMIPRVPLALSFDYKPFLNLTGSTGFRALDFGLGIKYTF